jgi:hypothetical protein
MTFDVKIWSGVKKIDGLATRRCFESLSELLKVGASPSGFLGPQEGHPLHMVAS